jgi:high affinity Mn2+ porin
MKQTLCTLPGLSVLFLTAPLYCAAIARAAETQPVEDAPDFVPQLTSAQYTGVDQHQYPLRSPYAGPLSLHPQGDTEQSHTFGAYLGVQLPAHFQIYADIEKFDGEGVSGATGLGGLTNGDVIRSGVNTLKKRPYFARHFVRYDIPLSDATHPVERGQDQLPGNEADHRFEFKLGKMAVNDDFDKNRYSNATRTQFMNWSLWNSSAWDFAADTRGYTNGVVAAYVESGWTLRYGIYQMPLAANGQTLESSLTRANGQNLELTIDPVPDRWILRILAFRNTARMGIYADAIALAVATGQAPDIRADDADGRHKTGFVLNSEVPLADDGDTGIFARYGRNDGRTESFVFTEVDSNLQLGGQLSGAHWSRPEDRLGLAYVIDGLSTEHRDYLADGGTGFTLGDGRLDYGTEKIFETYYSAALCPHVWLSPDFQFIRDPGYNRDRGPAKFAALRLHLEY